MYDETARYYDKLYDFKDYEGEARALAGLIREELGPGRKRLLDVACGTGRHLEFLSQEFDVEGLDLSARLLDVARERLPQIRFHEGDMRTSRLSSSFDVVICLFSSIGYMTDSGDLGRALRTMADHLISGGLLVVEPWFTPEMWRPNTVHAMLVDEPELKIARVNTSLINGRITVLDMHHLIGTPEGTTHVVEHHRLFLYTIEEMMGAFESAGLGVQYDPVGLTGRGLYVGRKGIAP